MQMERIANSFPISDCKPGTQTYTDSPAAHPLSFSLPDGEELEEGADP